MNLKTFVSLLWLISTIGWAIFFFTSNLTWMWGFNALQWLFLIIGWNVPAPNKSINKSTNKYKL